MLFITETKAGKSLYLSKGTDEHSTISWEVWARRTLEGEELEIITGDEASVTIHKRSYKERLVSVGAPPQCRMRFFVALLGAVTVAYPPAIFWLFISLIFAIEGREQRRLNREDYDYYLNRFSQD